MRHLALLSLAACGSPVSNVLFEEDAEFLAALPSAEHHVVGVAGDDTLAKALGADSPYLLLLTAQVAGDGNRWIYRILWTVDAIRALRPAGRTETTRTWGPFEWENDAEAVARMERIGGGRYDWEAVGLMDGEETRVLWGTHYAGETVSRGDGVFAWDVAAQARVQGTDDVGRVDVDYDNRDGVDQIVTYAGVGDGTAAPVDATYAFRERDADGDFQFRMRDLTFEGIDAPVTLEIRTRWLDRGRGRADAVATWDGPGSPVEWTQCWDDVGAAIYNHGVAADEGDAADCAFADFARVDRL